MDDMIANGIKTIAEMATGEIFSKVYETAERLDFMNHQTGAISSVGKDKPPIGHVMFDLESLVQAIARRPDASSAVTFISASKVTTILDYTGFRIHKIEVPLVQSPILAFLKSPTVADPKSAIRAINYNLKSAIIHPDPIPALTVLRFESSSLAEHANRPTDEGVSKSLKSKVTGSADIPDQFEVTFKMYPAISADLRSFGSVTVQMELHVDPTAGTVSFRPFPGSIDEAVTAGMKHIQAAIVEKLELLLDEASGSVFLGIP